MSTKREFPHSVPSVMATLMGLDEIPTQRPFQKKPRVLSENYLHRVSSIGVRNKCSYEQSLTFDTGQQVEYKNILQVLETLRTQKHHTTAVVNTVSQLGSSDVLNSRSVATKHNLGKNNGTLFSANRSLVPEKKERKRFSNGVESVGPRFRKERTKTAGHSTSTKLRGHSSLQEQEMSNETFDEEDSVMSHYSFTDPESLNSYDEACQPSPISVLDRLGKKETNSDYFKSVNASLHELHLQLELLKSKTSESYSEGSSMVVSSDDDNEEESEINQGLLSPFRVEESRDFSYMVDVLTEAGLQSGKKHDNYYKISNSIFETMEEKYGEQISWKRPERRLLFDRINFCLADILQPFTLTKSVAKRFGFGLGNDMIDELWALLVSQEEDLRKENEKILGKDDRWMELGDEIRVIGREIEDYLIDELVSDVSIDCF